MTSYHCHIFMQHGHQSSRKSVYPRYVCVNLLPTDVIHIYKPIMYTCPLANDWYVPAITDYAIV